MTLPFHTPEARAKSAATRAANAAARKAQRATGLHDPDASDRPPAGRAATPATRPRRRGASLKDQIAALLMFANAPLRLASPEDVLSPQEIDQLADALANDPWTAEPLRKIGKASPHMALVTAAITIAVPRLARRNLIPLGLALDVAGAGQLFAPEGGPDGASVESGPGFNPWERQPEPWPQRPDLAAVPLDSGRTPQPDRGDGDREIDPGSVLAGSAQLHDRGPNEG